MIQRIQTIYLGLSVICLALVFAFPMGIYELADMSIWQFDVYGLSYNGASPVTFMKLPLIVMIPLLAVFNLAIIFLFKNRQRQLKYGRISYVLHVVVASMVYIAAFRVEGTSTDIIHVYYGIGLYLPVASLAFTFLANRGIKKDEALVQSLDRLR